MKNSLKKEDIDTIISEATIDCYGLHEELSCLLTSLQDELLFPFKIHLLGLSLDVIAITEQHNLPKLIVLREGTEYSIDITDILDLKVDLVTPNGLKPLIRDKILKDVIYA